MKIPDELLKDDLCDENKKLIAYIRLNGFTGNVVLMRGPHGIYVAKYEYWVDFIPEDILKQYKGKVITPTSCAIHYCANLIKNKDENKNTKKTNHARS